MGINRKNYLTRLGIENENIKQTLEKLTNEDVEELYADKLVDIYISLQKDYRNKVEKINLEEIEDKLKEELYRQIGQMPPKVKIIILENKIDEFKKTKAEEISLEIRKKNYQVAYEALRTEEGRREYMGTLRKQSQFDQDLQDLIIKEEGNPKQILDTKTFSQGNVAKEVREEETQIPEYNVEYKDKDITLCHLASIAFNNGQFQDRFKRYILFANDEQSHISTGYSFYGDIEVKKMQDSHYRIALYQAIRQSMMEEKNYLGFLNKNEKGFYIVKDEAQELAVLEYERHQKEIMRNTSKQEGVR